MNRHHVAASFCFLLGCLVARPGFVEAGVGQVEQAIQDAFGAPVAVTTLTDGYVLTYDSTTRTYGLEADDAGGGGGISGVVNHTMSEALGAADVNKLHTTDGAGGEITLTLPVPAELEDGDCLYFLGTNGRIIFGLGGKLLKGTAATDIDRTNDNARQGGCGIRWSEGDDCWHALYGTFSTPD